MTSIAVRKDLNTFQVEDRSWLAGPAGTGPGQTPTVTLKVSAFPVGDGYVPSGTAISKDADGKWVPFNAAAVSGEHALLFGSLRNDRGDIGGAGLIAGFVHAAKLPGTPDVAALRTALPLIHFYA